MRSHHDLISWFEHDLRANVFRTCREGKPVSAFPHHAPVQRCKRNDKRQTGLHAALNLRDFSGCQLVLSIALFVLRGNMNRWARGLPPCRGRPKLAAAEISELGNGTGLGAGPALCACAAAHRDNEKDGNRPPSHPLAPAREDQPINAIPRKRDGRNNAKPTPGVAICLRFRGAVNRSGPIDRASWSALLFLGHRYQADRTTHLISRAAPEAC
jgi:hypothetical protein